MIMLTCYQNYEHRMDAISHPEPCATIAEGVETKNYDMECGKISSSISNPVKKKTPTDNDFDLHAKKSFSLRNRKLSFAGLSIGVFFFIVLINKF